MTTRTIEILQTAADALKTVRYDTITDTEQRAYLDALGDLTSEVTHLVDALELGLPEMLEPSRAAAGLDGRVSSHLPITAELLLTTLMQRRIDSLPQAHEADDSIIRDVPQPVTPINPTSHEDDAKGWVAVHEQTGDRSQPRPTPHEAIQSLETTLWTTGSWTLTELARLDQVAREIRQINPSPDNLDLYLTGTGVRLEQHEPARRAA